MGILENISNGVRALSAGLDLLGTVEGQEKVKARLVADDHVSAASTLDDIQQIIETAVKVAAEE